MGEHDILGPFDLAKQMNVVRGGEEHEAAIQRTLKAAKAAGKKAAIFCKFFTRTDIAFRGSTVN
jgi:2-keto-3-deoxy-L-rhamnonate aldolase RhmA